MYSVNLPSVCVKVASLSSFIAYVAHDFDFLHLFDIATRLCPAFCHLSQYYSASDERLCAIKLENIPRLLLSTQVSASVGLSFLLCVV